MIRELQLLARSQKLLRLFPKNEITIPISCLLVIFLSLLFSIINYLSDFYDEQKNIFRYLLTDFVGIVLLFLTLISALCLFSYYYVYIFAVRNDPALFSPKDGNSKTNLLYGTVQVVQWTTAYGVAFTRNNRIFAMSNPHSGGVAVIYPYRRESVIGPIYIGSRSIEDTYEVSFRGEQYLLEIHIEWKIFDLRKLLSNPILTIRKGMTIDNLEDSIDLSISSLVKSESYGLLKEKISTSDQLEDGQRQSRSMNVSPSDYVIQKINETIEDRGIEVDVLSFRKGNLSKDIFDIIAEKAREHGLEIFKEQSKESYDLSIIVDMAQKDVHLRKRPE